MELQETEALKFTTGTLKKCCNTSNFGKFKCQAGQCDTTLPFLLNQLLNKNKMLSAKICCSWVQICYLPILFSPDQPSFMHHIIFVLWKNCNTPNKFYTAHFSDSILLNNTQCYQGNKHGLQGILEAWVTATKNQLLLLIITKLSQSFPIRFCCSHTHCPTHKMDKFLLLGYFMILPGWKLSKEN